MMESMDPQQPSPHIVAKQQPISPINMPDDRLNLLPIMKPIIPSLATPSTTRPVLNSTS